MNEIWQEIIQEYENDLKLVNEQIKTFEEIYKAKAHKQEIRDLAKEILKKLYPERDEYARKTKFYRALHQKSQTNTGISAENETDI